uniref:Uncharacterized protein n=1 Tax=Anguilla anguilla TaxID=7936 RepID=A0A0E9RQA4_ANGAN
MLQIFCFSSGIPLFLEQKLLVYNDYIRVIPLL